MRKKSQKIFFNKTVFFLLLFGVFFPRTTFSQTLDSAANSINKKKFRTILAAELVAYSATMIGLNQLWYANYEREPFHFFDDNAEWNQMDKIGHFGSAYYLGYLQIKILRNCGFTSKKSMLLGGATGFIFLTSVEILDGFSKGWGASTGDIIANTAGYLFLIAQELAWKEQRIMLKFSMTPSPYAKYRPDLLGKNYQEQLLKDYNAQTYWLSINLGSFMKSHPQFPKWLNLAVGYGADGMISAEADKSGNLNQNFGRTRQFYLSLDLDLHRIKTKKVWLNTVLQTVGFIKIPFPTLEYNTDRGFDFHPLMF
ncbi:MAG: YfiM family protein [Bacteroidia bacterium]|nr:YfiM family protein [Bacteroidia bacterium]